MSIQLNRDLAVSGYIESESLRVKHQSFERASGVYYVTLIPDNPFTREELQMLCERELHQYQTLDDSDQPADTNLIRFESVNDPRLCPFDDGTYLGVGDHVVIDTRFELNSSDGEHLFLRAYLRRVSPFVDPYDQIDWDSMEDNGYNLWIWKLNTIWSYADSVWWRWLTAAIKASPIHK